MHIHEISGRRNAADDASPVHFHTAPRVPSYTLVSLFHSMSGKTFSYLADRAKEHATVTRRSQMHKVCYMISTGQRPAFMPIPKGYP